MSQSQTPFRPTVNLLRRNKSFKVRLKQNIQPQQQSTLGQNIENGFQVKFYFNRLLLFDYSLMTLTLVNMSLSVFYYDLDYGDGWEELSQGILYGMLFLLIFQIPVTWLRYKACVELEIKQKLLFEFEDITSSGKLGKMLLEMTILCFQPYPFLQDITINTSDIYDSFTFEYKINYILVMLGFLRVFIIFKGVLLSTSYMSPRANRSCRMYGCDSNYLYSIKCLFKNNPLVLMGTVFITSILLFALMIRMAERSLNFYYPLHFNAPDPQDLESFQNAIWLTIITMTTVGYGDFYPRTLIGRIVDTLLVVWGVFVVSSMVVLLTNTLKMDSSEKRALMVLNRLQAKKVLRQKSANLIATTFRKHYLVRKLKRDIDPNTKQQTQKQLKDVTRRLDKTSKQFSTMNRDMQSMYEVDNVYDEMTRQFEFVNDQISLIFESQNETKTLLKEYLSKSNEDVSLSNG